MSTNDVLKCPQEFLYIFASDQFLATLPSSQAKIINAKKQNQYYLLRNVICGGDSKKMQTLADQISTKLKDAFGYSPLIILQKLADGEEVAGKDWVNGIYGVNGKCGQLVNRFADNTGMSVDATDGRIVYNSNGTVREIADQTEIRSNNGQTVVGYSAVVDGVTYQSMLAKDGKYYASTYTDGNGQSYTAKGALMGLSGFQSLWSSIQGYLTLFKEIIEWLKAMFPALFNRTSLLKTQNYVPTQSDWGIKRTTDWKAYLMFGVVGGLLYYYFNRKGSDK